MSTTKAPAGPVPRGPGRGPGHGPGAMAMPVEKSMNFGPSARRLLGRMRPHLWLSVATVVLGAVSVALNVLGPKILGTATDELFSGVVGAQFPSGVTKDQVIAGMEAAGQTSALDMMRTLDFVPGQGVDFGAMGTILGAVALVYAGSAVVSLFQGRLAAVVVQRTVFTLREEAEAKLSRLPLKYFDGTPTGEVLSRVTNDVDNIQQSLQQTLSQMLTSLLTVVGVIVMMLTISPLLALVALVTVPVSVAVAAFVGKRAQPQFVQQWATTGRLNAHIEEMYTGHAVVRAFGRGHEAEAVFKVENDDLYGSSFRAQFISGCMMPLMNVIGNVGYLVVAVVGGLRVAAGAMSIGDVQAFIQYSRQFTQPITQVASMANLLQSGVASAERVFALLDEPEQSPEPASPVVPAQVADAAGDGTPRRGRVVFDDVSFSYSPDKPLIEGLDLTVEPGSTVAIVGPTGAGKTTIVNLLMRFYDVQKGRIVLDGVDTATMSREALRGQIGMVLQDTWLFGGTIAENIAYGAGDVTREQVVEAATVTYVDRFVRTLPDGYDTVVDGEGGNVSAGEKQLVTIARAFLANRSILVLDEATSSVDTRTEVLIQQAMHTLRQGRTSFVIAHRLSTIRDADTILVMEQGSIVEQGDHAQLLAADGAYARLYRSQFAAAAAELD